MPIRLETSAATFWPQFEALLASKREVSQDVEAAAAAIVEDVRTRGDEALAEYSLRFDRIDLPRLGVRISEDEIAVALGDCDAEALRALEFAHTRILAYHQRQKPQDVVFTDSLGVELGWRWRPIESVGLYVPGGAASYPSSVLMNAAPAKVAGCARIAMTAPTPDGRMNPLVLAAARLAGVDEIYRLGGAQAIAALAHGTASIRAVSK
ncbi:MAG TPA: histidinol dehydrogenase, partial [Roseiarcus sp.]|nr:histidinol dehydrogenase [Roseiarcus sp.]